MVVTVEYEVCTRVGSKVAEQYVCACGHDMAVGHVEGAHQSIPIEASESGRADVSSSASRTNRLDGLAAV